MSTHKDVIIKSFALMFVAIGKVDVAFVRKECRELQFLLKKPLVELA